MKTLKSKKMSESIADRQEQLADKYTKKYKGYMRVLESGSALSRACSLQPHHYAQLGMMLDKTKNYLKLKQEDGTLTDLGTVPQVALDVVTITFASSALAILANIQQIPDQTGLIYYEQTRATATRGNVTAGQILQNPLSAPDVYADGYSSASQLITVGSTAIGTTSYILPSALTKVPVRPQSVRVQIPVGENVIYAADPDGDGKLFGNGVYGTIEYETGDIVIKLAETPTAVSPISCTYSTDIEAEGNLATINVDLLTKRVDATAFALQAQIGMFKQYAMSKRLGINARDRLAVKLSDEMSNEITSKAINMIVANAQGGVEWNRQEPNGVSWFLHKQSFKDRLNDAEAVIFKNAGRGGITAYVCSHLGATLIKCMPGFVKASIPVGAGATLFGMYEGVPVIRAPQIADGPSTDYPYGVIYPLYKGDLPFDGALVYGSYMPLVAISDIPDSQNILNQKHGVATWGGFALTGRSFLTKVKITKEAYTV